MNTFFTWWRTGPEKISRTLQTIFDLNIDVHEYQKKVENGYHLILQNTKMGAKGRRVGVNRSGSGAVVSKSVCAHHLRCIRSRHC